jgi:hypothetical protein
MAVGDGTFAVPAALTESPDAQRARHVRDAENTFRAAVVAVLREARPLGRDLLVKAARKKGAKARSDKRATWLAAMAADPTSGVVNSADGFDLADGVSGLLPDPDPAMTPDSGSYRGNGLPTPPLPHDPSLKGVEGSQRKRGAPVRSLAHYPDQPRRGEAMSAPCTVCAGPTIRSDDGTRICLNASCPGDVTEHRQLDLIHRSLTEGRSNREDSGSEDNRPGPESAGQGKEEGSRRRRAPRGRRQRNRRGRS